MQNWIMMLVMNHTDVSKARDHVAAVYAAVGNLEELHDRVARLGREDHARRDGFGRQIAAQYDAIRTGVRLAEAHANIATAEALERIAVLLDGLDARLPNGDRAVTL